MAVRDAYTLADIAKMPLPVDVESTKGFLGESVLTIAWFGS